MMDLNKAYSIALKYFEDNNGISDIAGASEDNDFWYFRAGKKDEVMIGTIIISVDKNDGTVKKLSMLNKECNKRIMESKKVELNDI